MHAPGAHGFGPVLEVALTHVFHFAVHPIDNAVAHRRAHHNLARLAQGGQACCQVDAVAVHVVLAHIEVAGVDAGAQVQLLVGWQLAVGRDKKSVQRHGGSDRIHRIVELGQQTVPQAFDQTAFVLRYDALGGVVHKGAPPGHDRSFMGGDQAHRLHQIDHQHHLVGLKGQAGKRGRWIVGRKRLHGVARTAWRHPPQEGLITQSFAHVGNFPSQAMPSFSRWWGDREIGCAAG